jgi:hypothetical protein
MQKAIIGADAPMVTTAGQMRRLGMALTPQLVGD